MSAHKLFRLTQQLYLTPHLISQRHFTAIENYLSSRNAGFMPLIPPKEPESSNESGYQSSENLDDLRGVGVIDIIGSLTNKSTGWEAECGGCSYEGILEQMEDLVEYGATTIILNIDSGGGEAFGAFECANEIRSICNENNIRLISYVQGCAASAAYLLACVADEVICNPHGETGSIGVLISLCDESKKREMEGTKLVFVTAGEDKIPYADDGTFKKSFLDDLQEKVNFLYSEFVNHVSLYTGMSSEEVINTKARTFLAKDALSIGLINKIMTNKEFVSYIVNQRGATNA